MIKLAWPLFLRPVKGNTHIASLIAVFGAVFTILIIFRLIGAVGLLPVGWGMQDYPLATPLVLILSFTMAFPLFVWRIWIAQHHLTATLQQALHAEDRLDIDREAQNSILYLRAIEMLGAIKDVKVTKDSSTLRTEPRVISRPDIEIRIGAIFALERLAKESERDQSAILDMLCAYIRRNSGLDEDDNPMSEPAKGKQWPKPRDDIQTAITVIARRKERWKGGAVQAERIDLNGARLMRISAQGADFEGAYLGGARLQEAFLWKANLGKINLQGADLQEAFLQDANLQKATLQQANLQQANLQNAQLQQAFLWEANLFKANLHGAKLQTANLQGANLQGANLEGANLHGTKLLEDDQPKVLNSFRNRQITQAQIETAIGDQTTALPTYLIHPTHWAAPLQEGNIVSPPQRHARLSL